MRADEAFALRNSLTARQHAVLADLRRFRLLSASQLQRLHFADPVVHRTAMGAARATNRVLHQLQELKLISSLKRRVGGQQQGSAPTIWQLTERGVTVLHLGTMPLKRSRFDEPASSLFVQHTLAISEVAVQMQELSRETGLELLSLQTEPDCWRSFLGDGGQPETLRPDLYVVLANSSFEQHAYVEVDLATEHAPQLLRKCRLYARYASSGTAERDAGVVPRTLWVTPTTARARFIERVISGDRQPQSDLFEVVAGDPSRTIAAGLLAEQAS
jgi:hypothetical protein